MTTGPDDQQQDTPSPPSQRSFTALLNRVPPAVSFASLLFGVVLTAASVYNIPNQIAKSHLEIRQASLALYASEVKFEAFYLDVQSTAFHHYRAYQEDAARHVFWGYPVLRNDVFFDIVRSRDGGEREFSTAILPDDLRERFPHSVWQSSPGEIVLLVIRQIGKRMARDIRLEMNHLKLRRDRAVNVFASKIISEEGWLEIDHGGELQHMSIALGDLDTGQGLLIPLFIAYYIDIDEGCCRVAMESIYVPLQITFTDEFDGRRKEFDIRPMLETGFELTAGVTIRG